MTTPTRRRVAGQERLFGTRTLIVLAASSAYFLSLGIVLPVLPGFAAGDLAGGNLIVALVVGAPALAALFARPTAGRLGNRFGRRRLMIVGAVTAGASTLSYAAAGEAWQLVLLRLVTGAGEGVFFTGATTMVADLAPDQGRGTALSVLSVTVFAGTGLGPILGVPLAGSVGSGGAFAVAGCLAVLAGLIAACVREGAVSSAGERSRLINPKALRPGSVMALNNAGTAGFFAFVPLYAPSVGASVQASFAIYAGVILTIRTLGAQLPDRLGPGRCCIAANVLSGLGMLVVSLAGSATEFLAGVVVFALGGALLYPALLSLTLGRSAPHERSSLVGTFTMSFDAGQITGSLALGAVAQTLGLRASFAAAAVLSLVGLLSIRLPADSPAHRSH